MTQHLDRTKMSKTAADLLEQLAASLPTHSFVSNVEEFEVLVHPQLLQIVQPLLAELGFSNKRFSIIRVPGPKPSPLWNSTGPAHMIPIITLDNSQPTVSDQPLAPGEITYIKFGVSIMPKIILLLVQA